MAMVKGENNGLTLPYRNNNIWTITGMAAD